jgi:diguanylate cyclase (GGDEF)-like protein/PAS domain S-box-containing protein
VRDTFPSGQALPDEQWERHHAFVLRVLIALSVAVSVYSALLDFDLLHAVGHAAPLVLLTLVATARTLPRDYRAAAAATGLMTAAAVAVHAAHGATEAHFLFFALLPLAAVYAARTPFLLAVGYVAVHHFVFGSLAPESVFEDDAWPLGMAGLHAAFVLTESIACLVAWRLFEDRRELVEHLVLERTSELRDQRDVLSRLAAVVESTDDAVITTTTDGVVVTWNPGAERLYGHAAVDVVGEHISLVFAAERRYELDADLAALARKESLHVERLHQRRDGSPFDALVTASAISDASGTITGVVGIARDISARKRNEAELAATARKLEARTQELSHLALHDPLTGLANRALLQDRLEQGLAGRAVRQHAVLLLDLDDFKAVNDVWGHAVGDAVLVQAARRLVSCARATDTVARLGGDEFVLLLQDVVGREDVDAFVGRMLTALAEPIDAGVGQFVLQASVGITMTDGTDGRGPTELLRDTDIAMYAAKASGKGRCQVFQPDMHDRVVAHDELVRDLRAAVDNGELRLLFQPQVELSTGRVTGVEALVRWERSGHGLVAPGVFISAAEQTGMIGAIDDWVLREACHQLRAWDQAGLEPLHVAVNVSASRLLTDDLAGTVAAVTGDTGIDPGRLEIEITETVAVEHDTDAVATIRRLRALGVHVAVDDFGMGHSSLSRLQDFPVDRLKIDRSFVAPLGDGSAHGSIADAMIALGQSLGLAVTAEGVETDEQLHALRTLGCATAQGYLFSKPVPAAEIERLVASPAPFAPPHLDAA